MDSNFTFWFWGMVISMALTILAYVTSKINNKWGHQEYNRFIEATCESFFVFSCWCFMFCMMCIFG